MATQHVHAEAAVCIPKHCRRSAIPGQHAICFHKSHILANVVPVGFYFGGFTSTAGYVPATRLRIAPERLGSPLAFISKGCYPFLSGRSRKPRSFLSQAFRLQHWASLDQQPPVFPLSRALPPRLPIPVLVIETRKPRDREVYTRKQFFRQTFMCFIFLECESEVVGATLRGRPLSGQVDPQKERGWPRSAIPTISNRSGSEISISA